MLISIIIPTLNEESCISRLLDDLENHPNQKSFEVIVVDGGSRDRTVEIATNFNVEVLITKEATRAHQMNVGAKHSNGDILYFVHADTQLVDSFADDILEAYQNGILSGCYRFKFHRPQNPLLHINGFFTRFPFKWCRGGDQTLFIERVAFNNINGYDEKYVIMEDYDILEKIENANIPFTIIPKSVLVSSRKYDSNSYMKVQLTNLKAMRMYKNGVNPSEIRQFYCESLDGKYKEDQLFLGN